MGRYERITQEEFLKQAKEKYGDMFDYSKTDLTKRDDKGKVIITCPKHGDFKVQPKEHLRGGGGCKRCWEEKRYLTNEKFIKRAKKKHGDKYDYSKTDVDNRDSEGKVIVTCPKHGDFKITPSEHLRGRGCRECYYDSLRIPTEEFIAKSKAKFGEKFDYSKCVYKGRDKEITLICPIHGEFQTTPRLHLSSQFGCKYCYRGTTEEFIEKAREIHGDKYDYTKTDLNKKDKKGKVIITCKKHGDFKIRPILHLYGIGCKKCGIERGHLKQRKPQEQFIAEARAVHGDKYDYSKVNYIKSTIEVIITCPKHGDFPQTPDSHLRGEGCPKCGLESQIEKRRKTQEQFIEEAKAVHGDRYDYSKVVYKGNNTDITIICPKHGEFPQTPHNHLSGEGCPFCKQSRLEDVINLGLKDLGIDFEYNKKYKILNNLQLDFYIPSKKIAIECQGRQHFEPVDFSGKLTEEQLLLEYEQLRARDQLKRKLCEQNGIKLLYFSNLGIEYPYEVFEDKEKLFEEINKF